VYQTDECFTEDERIRLHSNTYQGDETALIQSLRQHRNSKTFSTQLMMAVAIASSPELLKLAWPQELGRAGGDDRDAWKIFCVISELSYIKNILAT
jgi:hypothetical protein